MPVIDTKNYPDLGKSDSYGARGSWLQKLFTQPPGSERALKLCKRLDEDAARLPIADGAPPLVLQAHAEFLDCLAKARAAAVAVEQAHTATEDAGRVDVDGAASSLRKGVAVVAAALRRPKAKAAEELALTTCLGAERMGLDALQALTDAVRDTWQEWRELLIVDAATATGGAMDAFEAAAAAIETRTVCLARISELDREIAKRMPEEAEAAGLEVGRDGAGRPQLVNRSAFNLSGPLASVRAGLDEEHRWARPLGAHAEEAEPTHAHELLPPEQALNR